MSSMQPSSLKHVIRASARVWQERMGAEVPPPRRLLAAVSSLSAATEANALPEVTVAQIQGKLITAYEQSGLQQASRRELRQGCQVWFLGDRPPGRARPVASAVVKQVSDRRLRAGFMALIDAYLHGFDEQDADVAWLGQQLGSLASQWQWRDYDAWPERLKRYPLFDPDLAVDKVAEAVIEAGPNHRRVFEDIGLDSAGRSHSGFEEAVFRAVCRMVGAMKGQPARQSQDWLIDWAQVGDRTMAFPKAWPDFAGALFLPWQNEHPGKSHQTRVMDTAIRYAGDPRITPLRWKEVQDRFATVYSTVLRWLTEASVKQFFDIVSQMLDGNDSAMWEARRKFWTAYLDAGHITAAWVAFGSTGERYALQAARLSGDASLKMFGRLIPGSGRSPQQCALLMHIGDMTIAEWSHNGKCRFWPRGSRGAPQLFRMNARGNGDYSAYELMTAPLEIAHMSGWQTKFSKAIHDHTNVQMRFKSRASIRDVR